ncbi:hypothetical protein PF049_01020 [Erythrobacteraceae bacterium WH01K]|nr:hypothetical protein PF049_01020 [Erythrobacteraceae bacterium WH01K]
MMAEKRRKWDIPAQIKARMWRIMAKRLALPQSRHYLGIRSRPCGGGFSTRPDTGPGGLTTRQSKEINMRKIALVAAATAALSLAACSEGTQDAAEATAEGAMADTEANMDAMAEGTEDAMADAEAGAEEMAADAEAGAEEAAVEAEAAMEGETEEEAAAD